jgi:DNA-binding NarL/FixJ family response regulator
VSAQERRVRRVLVVDGHLPIRETLTELLRSEPDVHVVAACATGAEALDAAERFRPDVVLIDPQLPDGEDGAEVVRRLVAALPGSRVLILTAIPHDRLVLAAVDAGAHAVLVKSAPYSAILAAVHAG